MFSLFNLNLSIVGATPLKFNMEPEKKSLEKEIPFVKFRGSRFEKNGA